ncbi:amidohydrolase family protein [Amycolatopsis solani]|uniref:amidohydrolase family protein n=1 Tax=Amycolatopsis solani TaxID=3028615 RepID=UPI0025B201AA|nr:amidohydrolase family protein [Amycolatopsis sp. MEP2-6]
MTLICVEEHAIDQPIAEAAGPVLAAEAPYLRMQSSSSAPVRRGPGRRPAVELQEALRRGADLGEERIRRMDEHGIDRQIVSWTSPIQLVPADKAIGLCRSANDRLSRAVAAHPDRLQGLAALPWQLPSAAVDELDRAVTGLGLRGVLILGRPGAGFLDDPAYQPVLDRIAALRVPLYVHPFHPVPQVRDAYYTGFNDRVSAELALGAWGWHHEAGIHVLRLILAGVFDRLPGLQVISGHWGEMVPFHLSRLDDVLSPGDTGLSRTITEIYRSHVWVTPSGMFDRPHFDFVRAVVGLDRVIWSTDYPFLHLDGTRAFLDELDLTPEDREKITHRNAEHLFRLAG